mmetsp:Transcript_38191/g.51683  ORF Transcript_38191/g.51683 Transcript_38191/m.51683 type:complete len:87 (-) Transcript_38191:249-509(-)
MQCNLFYGEFLKCLHETEKLSIQPFPTFGIRKPCLKDISHIGVYVTWIWRRKCLHDIFNQYFNTVSVLQSDEEGGYMSSHIELWAI